MGFSRAVLGAQSAFSQWGGCQQGHAWLSDVEQHLPKEALLASHTFFIFPAVYQQLWESAAAHSWPVCSQLISLKMNV